MMIKGFQIVRILRHFFDFHFFLQNCSWPIKIVSFFFLILNSHFSSLNCSYSFIKYFLLPHLWIFASPNSAVQFVDVVVKLKIYLMAEINVCQRLFEIDLDYYVNVLRFKKYGEFQFRTGYIYHNVCVALPTSALFQSSD